MTRLRWIALGLPLLVLLLSAMHWHVSQPDLVVIQRVEAAELTPLGALITPSLQPTVTATATSTSTPTATPTATATHTPSPTATS
ncbi:MAG TPA: hypothetical protein VLC52_03505, partial [Anaerolineae bacterium]|nr:hypothetical protein [Anaerolineae bacterium]